MRGLAALSLLVGLAAPARATEALVDIETVAPGVRLDIRYATASNFTKQVIYREARCVLRASVARRIARVQAALARAGFGLKLFDCYRPLSVQRRLWQVVPDPRYVADPKVGSKHNRGAAVDLTLVTSAGVEVAMPTEYDDFTPRAHRDFRELPADVLANRTRLEAAMAREGFIAMPTEWWHFDAPDWKAHPLSDEPLPARTTTRAGPIGRGDTRQGGSFLGKPPPELPPLYWLDGKKRSLRDLRGQVVVLRNFTEGCPFCETALPALEAWHRALAPRGLTVLGIYHPKPPRPTTPADAARVATSLGATFPIANDPTWAFVEKWWLGRTPDSWTSITFILDRAGRVRHVHPGGEYHPGGGPDHAACRADHAEMSAVIEKLLTEPTSD